MTTYKMSSDKLSAQSQEIYDVLRKLQPTGEGLDADGLINWTSCRTRTAVSRAVNRFIVEIPFRFYPETIYRPDRAPWLYRLVDRDGFAHYQADLSRVKGVMSKQKTLVADRRKWKTFGGVSITVIDATSYEEEQLIVAITSMRHVIVSAAGRMGIPAPAGKYLLDDLAV